MRFKSFQILTACIAASFVVFAACKTSEKLSTPSEQTVVYITNIPSASAGSSLPATRSAGTRAVSLSQVKSPPEFIGYHYSGCRGLGEGGGTLTRTVDARYSATTYAAENVSITLISNVATVVHDNVEANCCIRGFEVTSENLSNNIIQVIERVKYNYDSTGQPEICRCICSYTLTSKLLLRERGVYTIQILDADRNAIVAERTVTY